MYLQALEILGFKSFANKTRLVFEPGITAIVGPNGCGKSNVSDAIRWVLGEQRPTALRGSAMTDVIFNGTDTRKPLGMTEVSITFADCEKELGTEYNEVSITRRVFRTGESQYFINRTPCRLKDIQRLFMGTGVGTSSYSVMAQGQIDAVLSSRPEDRRTIFEEASGITRFRADRKEAMRKLEQTEANLVRLNDVIRELHRQIGSLQRQAGKAKRYKELQGELRKLDLYVTINRVVELDKQLDELVKRHEELFARASELKEAVQAGEEQNLASREELMEFERSIGLAMEAAMQAQGRRNQIGDAIRFNEERILEYKEWSKRDEQEIAETKTTKNIQEDHIADLAEKLEELEGKLRDAEGLLSKARMQFDAARSNSENARNELNKLRSESVELERTHMMLQNELTATENAAREMVLKKERLSSEKVALSQNIEKLESRLDEVSGELETLNAMVDTQIDAVKREEQKIASYNLELKEKQKQRGQMQSELAVLQARIQFLTDSNESANELPGGTRLVLDKANPLGLDSGVVVGSVAEQFSAPKEYRLALEAVLRAWFDAVAVSAPCHVSGVIEKLLSSGKEGVGVRLVSASVAECGRVSTLPQGAAEYKRLLDVVTCKEEFKDAAENILGNVLFVEDIKNLPSIDGVIFVTKDGVVVFPNGFTELWMPEGNTTNLMSRHMMAEDLVGDVSALEEKLVFLEDEIAELYRKIESSERSLASARQLLDQSSRAAAQKEGEENTLEKEVANYRTQHARVSKEYDDALNEMQSGSDRSGELTRRLKDLSDSRTRIADAVVAQSELVKESEEGYIDAQTELTDARLAHASVAQSNESLQQQYNAGVARLAELDRIMSGRISGLKKYEEAIAKLTDENNTNAEALEALDADVVEKNKAVEVLREERAGKQRVLEQAERVLQGLRVELDGVNTKQNQADIALAEAGMRKQNIYDRLMLDWHMTPEQLVEEPPAIWEDGAPEISVADERIKEIRTKMEEMGPVNLVAIEEYQEIEERHAFLVEQESDLTNAKARLIELIKEIDQKSTAMFKETFDKANVNFQNMFQRLFNGGTAQLNLLDGDDILECGIDIVARPPGKKPQSVSLLSGGERTMTAVALLFAIYMIKPSPFAMLDELDAALDDSNIGRFVGVLKDFLEMSQFLIITHNQHTIAGADIVYGVTQQEKGISKIISMRLKRIGVEELREEELPEVAAPPPPSKRKMKKFEDLDEEQMAALPKRNKGKKKKQSTDEQESSEEESLLEEVQEVQDVE